MDNGLKLCGICTVLLLLIGTAFMFFEKVEAGYVGVKVLLVIEVVGLFCKKVFA